MAGIEVIDRPQLNSDVTKHPIIDPHAASDRRRCVRQGTSVVDKSAVVPANQTVHKGGNPARAISEVVTRPEHVGEIAAVKSSTVAIVKAMAADVGFRGEVMKPADRGGHVPAIHTQGLRSRTRARIRRQIKVEVGVAAEYIDGNVLSGSAAEKAAEKKESCQSEAGKFFHVPYCASRDCKNRTAKMAQLTEYRIEPATRSDRSQPVQKRCTLLAGLVLPRHVHGIQGNWRL